MIKNTIRHPSIIYADDIKSICKPLLQLKINYFAHALIDRDNQFSAMTSNPDFCKYYIDNQCYNFDFHMADTSVLGRHIIWDAIKLSGKAAVETKVAKQFGIDHVFTIEENDTRGKNFYYFASNILGGSINQIYLSNINLLYYFISYYKDKVYKNRYLSSGYDIKFPLDLASGGCVFSGESEGIDMLKIKYDFINNINLLRSDGVRYQILSSREAEILSWLHNGKTVSQIALILKLAEVTVNKHISKIKEKTQCYTQFQLGEFYSRENFKNE